MDFADAMRAAIHLTRAQRLAEATRVIQHALAGREQTVPGEVVEVPAIDHAPAGTGATLLAIAGPAGAVPDAPPQRRVRSSKTARPLDQMVAEFSRPELSTFPLNAFKGLKARKPLEIPDGGQFLSHSFACAAGSRDYRLYVPSDRGGGKRPLIIMLHGGTQDGDDFAAGTRMHVLAEEHGLIVAYISQSKAANASLCWNWFMPEHQMREHGEPSIIAGITTHIAGHYDVDPRRVFIAGLSAGGAMSAVMGATYPDLYAAIGIHSGLPYRSAVDVASAFAAMRGDRFPPSGRQRQPSVRAHCRSMRTIVFHGDADKIVHPSNAKRIAEMETKARGKVERSERRHGAGRPYTRTVTRDENGDAAIEQWIIHGAGHAWSGGSPDGSYADPHGPDASREMVRFFLKGVEVPK